MNSIEKRESLVDRGTNDRGHLGRYYPTVFVACGGAGTKVLERVRRQTIEYFGGLADQDLPGVAYVCFDTDVGSRAGGHQQEAGTTAGALDAWLGQRDDERLDLDGSRIQPYIASAEALVAQPHVSEWFDPVLLETAQGINLSYGAGQLRPLGRLAAWANREPMVARLKNAFRKVTSMNETSASQRVVTGDKVNVVICGSFAGGTGAGIFLDVAAMIRELEPAATITGQFLLPDVFASLDGDARIKANGYACLAELNHYATNPYRVRWEKDAQPVEIPVLFDRTYLFEGQNEGGKTIARAADAYDLLAETLFLDFTQGGFAFARTSVQVNRAQVLLQVHRNRVEVTARRSRRQPGAAAKVQAETDGYRQTLCSAGLARVGSSSGRLFNRMRYRLSTQVLGLLLTEPGLSKSEPLREALEKQLEKLEALERQYATPRSSIVTTFVDDDGSEINVDEAADAFLGLGAAAHKKSLTAFIDRMLASANGGAQAAASPDRAAAVRTRLETDPDDFVQHLLACAHLALRGFHGTTDWFGEERPALAERSVADALLARYGTPDAREIADLAQDALKRALPWINTNAGVAVRGAVRDCYVILPESTPKNRPVVNAFVEAICAAASTVPGMNVALVWGSSSSEFLVYVEASGLIPASIASLHGADGMAAAYNKVRHDRPRNGVRSCVHLDRDGSRFADLVPLSVKDAEATLAAWRLLLLGVMLGVVTTKRNPLRVDALEAFANPTFTLTVSPHGPTDAADLGQGRLAVRQITDNPMTRETLGGAVARAFADQPVERYVQLLALVHYYKTCIFPLRKPHPDEGAQVQPVPTLAYVALEHIESEILAQVQRAKGATADDMMELVRFDLPPVLWALHSFARPSGQARDNSAVREGFTDEDRYAEIPAGRPLEHDDAPAGRIRGDLLALVATFVPRPVQDLVALNRDLVVYPWLALAPGAAPEARLPPLPSTPTLPPVPTSGWQPPIAPASAQQQTTSADLLAALQRELTAVQAHLVDVRRERDELRTERDNLRALLRELRPPAS